MRSFLEPRALPSGVHPSAICVNIHDFSVSFQSHACLSSHTMMAPANIFNGNVFIRLSNTLILFAIIDVPGWRNNSLRSRNSVDTVHVPGIRLIPHILRSFSACATLFSGVYILVPLPYKNSIGCLKVDSIPRRLI